MYPNLPFNAFPFTREGWSTEYFLNSSKMEGHQVSFGKELLENSSLLWAGIYLPTKMFIH